MKKLFLIAAVLMLVPFTAFAAMTPVSDSVMENVVGQDGVSIVPCDINLDLSIENIAYGDTDSGTVAGGDALGIAGFPHSFSAGYVNITGLKVNNIHATMSGTGILDGFSETGLSLYANPLEIDVVTFASNTTIVATRDVTAVAIGMGDMSITIDSVEIGDITLDPAPVAVSAGGYDDGTGFVEGLLNTNTGQFEFVTTASTSPSFGFVQIDGIHVVTRSMVGGFDPATGAPINPNHRGQIFIYAH